MVADPELMKRITTQIERIKSTVAQRRTGLVLIFDPNPLPSTVRFRVISDGNIPIIESSGHLRLDELESWSDERLCEALISLGGGRF